MAGEIRFEFDEITVRNIEKRLGLMRSEAPKALKNALNATAKDARRDLAREAQKTYAVKVGGFTRHMKLTPASTGNLEAVIKARGSRLQFRYFSVWGGKGPKGAPLRVLINKKHGRKTFGHGSRAFRNRIGGGMTAARRAGASRTPYSILHTVSIPQMIGNERDVYGVVEPNILSNLRKNVDRQVSRILGG